MKYEVEPLNDKWVLKKNGIICGIFITEELARHNIEIQKNLEKLKGNDK